MENINKKTIENKWIDVEDKLNLIKEKTEGFFSIEKTPRSYSLIFKEPNKSLNILVKNEAVRKELWGKLRDIGIEIKTTTHNVDEVEIEFPISDKLSIREDDFNFEYFIDDWYEVLSSGNLEFYYYEPPKEEVKDVETIMKEAHEEVMGRPEITKEKTIEKEIAEEEIQEYEEFLNENKKVINFEKKEDRYFIQPSQEIVLKFEKGSEQIKFYNENFSVKKISGNKEKPFTITRNEEGEYVIKLDKQEYPIEINKYYLKALTEIIKRNQN